METGKWTVLDLFSGGGGMSYGFHTNSEFKIVGAVDAQHGKPSSGKGSLECNSTYHANMGLTPINSDLSIVDPKQIRGKISGRLDGRELDVLISCAPCTGFSRMQNKNHIVDDFRNSLVSRSSLFVGEFKPKIFVMENARELLMGRFSHHFNTLRKDLESMGYCVKSKVHFLNEFGLPQKRERSLVIAVAKGFESYSLEDLWNGYGVKRDATTVRRAIGDLPQVDPDKIDSSDPNHVFPRNTSVSTVRRLELMTKDGMSWSDLKDHPESEIVLTPAMKRYVDLGKLGSHPDVYGRLWWDRPAVTIKRECGHVGNGRYSHPEKNRLCTVREMGILQGFPKDYKFSANSLTNMYRHIGDAVPPLISFQISKVCQWILSGDKPEIKDCILRNTSLTDDDILEKKESLTFNF